MKQRSNRKDALGCLTDRRALITGSTRGIGLAIASRFLKEGASVVINSEAEDADAVNARTFLKEYGCRTSYVCADVSQSGACSYLVAEAVERFGGLDILVNCAAYVEMDALEALEDGVINRILHTNLQGPLLVTKAALPHLIGAAAMGLESCIVNIGSSSGIEGHAGLTAYSASKGGLHALTRALARELAGTHVRCNAVIPGWIENAVSEEESDEDREAWMDYLKRCPLHRPGKMDEVAAVVARLASADFRYVNAQLLLVDGDTL